MDLRSNEIYNYIKYHAIKNLDYNENDWYRGVLKIEATDDKDCYGLPIPFP